MIVGINEPTPTHIPFSNPEPAPTASYSVNPNSFAGFVTRMRWRSSASGA